MRQRRPFLFIALARMHLHEVFEDCDALLMVCELRLVLHTGRIWRQCRVHGDLDSIEQCREACIQISGSQPRPGFEYRQSDVGQMAHDSTVKGTPAATSGKKPPS